MTDKSGVNFIFTYYGQLDHLVNHLELFRKLNQKDPVLKEKYNLTFVNDGFNDREAFESILAAYKDDINITGFKVTEDIGFNSHGCRNLAMLKSEYYWNMLLDMDCYLNKHAVYQILHTKLKDNIIYCFKVKKTKYNPDKYDYFDEKGILKIVAHPNVFLINKPCFWSGGGYDIEFAGLRYGDKEFFVALNKDKYDHELLLDNEGHAVGIKLQSPLRSDSYINGASAKSPNLKFLLDFVTKRNDNIKRKLKKRLICFNWQQVI